MAILEMIVDIINQGKIYSAYMLTSVKHAIEIN